MPFNNAKYDLELNNVGLRIENYRKSETQTFIPRLGSGDQSESDFDLLRTQSLESFSGGMLQREWEDDNAFFGSENLVPIYDDGVVYPVKALSSASDIMGKSTVTARCQTQNYLWLAINNYSGPTYNTIVRIDSSGTKQTITLPASIGNNTENITSLVVWNDQIWGCVPGSQRMFYFAQTATSATEITGGGGCPTLMTVWQGTLYGTGSGANDINVGLYRFNGDTSTRAWTNVGSIESKVSDYNAALFKYNGRIMLTRSDGMWAYDGIRLAIVDDASSNVNSRNYRFPVILKGFLHFFMHDGFYRYNGSMMEKLYDISEVGFPVDAVPGKNRIWIIYNNSADAGSSRYDKSMGYDYSSGSSINGRVAIYDGKAMYTYARTSNDSKPVSPDLNDQGTNAKVVWFADKIYIFTYYSKGNPGIYFYGSTNELSATGTAQWQLVTSIFDAGFAMINKSLENIEIVLDGDATSDETITLQYRTSGFSGGTGWTNVGSIKTQSQLKEYVFRTLTSGLLFKKIQFRLTATTTVGYGIRKLVFRFLLVPDFKWQWTFSVNAFGDNPTEPLLLKDMSQDTQSVTTLRGAIYSARDSGVPVSFTDVDQLDLNGAHNAAVTTVTLNSTALLKKVGFVKIDDEIISYTAKTATTLTGCERGLFGTTAATHADNAAVFPFYRALVRTIQSERVEMDDSDLDREEDKAKPSQISIVLQEV